MIVADTLALHSCAFRQLFSCALLSAIGPDSLVVEVAVQMQKSSHSPNLEMAANLPYQFGALYNRRTDIHDRWGGQRQGGISTPKDAPFVFIFTGEAGKSHGYEDRWGDDGVLDYFGEGQSGNMTMTGGNRAIDRHVQEGKRLLVFKSLGHGKPYRFDGEFIKRSSSVKPNTPATRGPDRDAIVFRLEPIESASLISSRKVTEAPSTEAELGSTVVMRLGEVRTKQQLFRRRLIDVEKQCRLTKVMDLRFLRASHIKPWAACATSTERTDGNNGLLLTPTADLLFDRGWISFETSGRLLVSGELPSDVSGRIGLKLKSGRACGAFNVQQSSYLEFHQNAIFEKRYRAAADPVSELISDLGD
jgi:hypothetical protein